MSAEVTDNPELRRFEITVDGEPAGFLDYRFDDQGTRVLVHTEVDRAFEGQGVGGRLARGVLDLLRERGETVSPRCPFLAGFIRKHPEYLDIVVPEMRDGFERRED